MKTDIKEFNGRKYLLLIPESKDEIEIVKMFGGKDAQFSGRVRQIEQAGKIGQYLRITIPAPVAATPANLLNQIPIAYCDKCRAEIFWLRNNKTGKPSPIDAVPTERGNCKIYSTTHFQVLAGQELTKVRQISKLNTNHFVTCPNADDFRKPKGK
jgi:hypothetical protein